jgi:hypothetical protein
MSIPNTRERKVRPTHPGEMLREDYLPDYGLTISAFAKALGVSRQAVNELLRERRSVSPERCYGTPGCLATRPNSGSTPSGLWIYGRYLDP